MQNMPSSNEFEPEIGTCETHGDYPLNIIDESGDVRWFSPVCPACDRQSKARKLFLSSEVPMRFIDATFENYITETPEQKAVLDRCVKYANEFEKMRSECVNLLLTGSVGTGKNHLATSIIRQATSFGFSALRVKAQGYLNAYWGKGFDEREGWLKKLASVDLLWIDELGRSTAGRPSQNVFFELLDSRYESKCPTIVTTNYNRDQLISEDMLGEAAYDRLTQGGGIRLTLNWQSYRARG